MRYILGAFWVVLFSQILSLSIPSPWLCINQPYFLQKPKHFIQFKGISIRVWSVGFGRQEFWISTSCVRIPWHIVLFYQVCCEKTLFWKGLNIAVHCMVAKAFLKSHLNFNTLSIAQDIFKISIFIRVEYRLSMKMRMQHENKRFHPIMVWFWVKKDKLHFFSTPCFWLRSSEIFTKFARLF